MVKNGFFSESRLLTAQYCSALLSIGWLSAVACSPQDDDEDAPPLGVVAQPVVTGHKYGIRSQPYYQNTRVCYPVCVGDVCSGETCVSVPWQNQLPLNPQLGDNFHTVLQSTDTLVFKGDLRGTAQKNGWKEGTDTASNYGLDSVDLFFECTHGGIYADSSGNQCSANVANIRSRWAMYESESIVDSTSMRLGDDKRGLSVFVNYSCATMQLDACSSTRLYPMFAGGLRVMLGFHGRADGGPNEAVVGWRLAQYLQLGWNFPTAWLAAATYLSSDNTAIAMATGTSCSDCGSRMANMNWTNFRAGSFPRVRDGNIGCTCYNAVN